MKKKNLSIIFCITSAMIFYSCQSNIEKDYLKLTDMIINSKKLFYELKIADYHGDTVTHTRIVKEMDKLEKQKREFEKLLNRKYPENEIGPKEKANLEQLVFDEMTKRKPELEKLREEEDKLSREYDNKKALEFNEMIKPDLEKLREEEDKLSREDIKKRNSDFHYKGPESNNYSFPYFATAIVDKAHFYKSQDVNSKRNAYIIKGQEIKVDKEDGEFIYAEFDNNGKVTEGWMLKNEFEKK